jgi:hypothetical protein
MSIIGDIGNFVRGAAKSVAGIAESLWHAITSVWGFLRHLGALVSGAWDWMVNGIGWFASQIGEWASWVYNTIWHIVTKLIPEAVAWAFTQATRWAARAIHTLSGWAKGAVSGIIRWAKGALHEVGKLAEHLYNKVTKWVNTAVQWVGKYGARTLYLLSHPLVLAEWLFKGITVPFILFILRVNVRIWFAVAIAIVKQSSGFAHLLEEVIARVI